MIKSLVFLACTIAYISAGCPEGAKPFGSKCYQFIDSFRNFDLSVMTCWSTRSNLTSINDLSENFFIQYSAGTAFNGSSADIWIGGTVYPSQWIWVDNSSFSWTNWKNDASINDTKPRHCISMDLSTGLWLSSDCGERKPFVCEIPNVEETTTATTVSLSPTNNVYDTIKLCDIKFINRILAICKNKFIPLSQDVLIKLQLLESKCCNAGCANNELKMSFCPSN